MNQDENTKNPKESATKLAIARGMALIRRELAVIGIKPSGEEIEISSSDSRDDVWPDALSALETPITKLSVDEYTTQYEQLDIYTDGGSRGNPGPSASGYVIMTTEKAILDEGGEYLGITTNNQAEYQAVKLALEEAKKFEPKFIDFYIDSMLVVNQMNGTWKIKNKDLWPIHEAIKELAAGFEKVTFTHVRREFNTLADEQVNIVLDSHQGKDA